MTVEQLKKRLDAVPGNLEIFVRCTWYPDGAGGAPQSEVFAPRVLVHDVDQETREEFVAIECDQEWD
jgi:hypothetical protein